MYIYVHECENNGKGTLNLQERYERYMKQFRGRKRKEEMT